MNKTFDSFGLMVAYFTPNIMAAAHRHNEIELNLLASGSMVYLFGAGQITVEAGQLAVFWGAVPHQLIHVDEGTQFHCVTLPLAWFLRWDLPTPFVQKILHGQLITEAARENALDLAVFGRWSQDFAQGSAPHLHIILLELEARLLRVALDSAPQNNTAPLVNSKAEAMAAYIAAHYSEALTVEAIAGVVKLHPNYAMSLFRKTYHVSLLDYLTQHRITHAQRLLATTDLRVIDIALDCGFGSHSRFYEAFRHICNQSPGEYRAALNAPMLVSKI